MITGLGADPGEQADLQCSRGTVAGTEDLAVGRGRAVAQTAYPDEPWRLAILDSVKAVNV